MSEINESVYEVLESRIGEMGSDPTSGGLVVPQDFLDKVKKSDDDPMFVTVEVETDGINFSGSRRRWKPEHVKQVVKKVNEQHMAGNLGHPLLDPQSYERDFPEPQVVWVAAKTEEHGNKTVGKFKGYVLKTAKARDYLRLGLIDGISWFGQTTMKTVKGGYEVITFDPETIDFARKGRSGMNSRVLALAGEMTTEGGKVEPRDIAALSVDELRTHAPLLVREIERQAVEPVEEKVGEQTAMVATLTPEAEIATKVRELMGLAEGENPVEKLTNLISQIEDGAKTEIRAFIKTLVDKKVKSTRGQALLERYVGEMWTEYDGPLTDELKTKIESDFEAKIEADEPVKALVGEMEGWTDETTTTNSGNGGGSTLGGRSRLGTTRGSEETVGRTGHLRKKTVKL